MADSNTYSFRTALQGFNRADVVHFIEQNTAAHEAELRQLLDQGHGPGRAEESAARKSDRPLRIVRRDRGNQGFSGGRSVRLLIQTCCNAYVSCIVFQLSGVRY